jgi:putative membrane protein
MAHWMGYEMVWWMWALMIVGTLGLWALVILVVRAAFHGKPAATPPPSPSSGPVRLLDDRLARGEISSEEYQRARNLLDSPH